MTFVVDKSGNNPTDVRFPKQTPLGSKQITIGAAATLVSMLSTQATFALPAAVRYAVLTVETANIRWADDGSTPTTTVGNLVIAGNAFGFAGDFTKLRFVAVSGSPVVDCEFFDRSTGWAG